MSKTVINLPVGRLVRGSLYKSSSVNSEGEPLVWKSGEKKGQPRSEFYFEIAIPKEGSSRFQDTLWGREFAAVAAAAWPRGESTNGGDFSWKVEDGDSTHQGKRKKRPCDVEGYAGNWIVTCKGSFAPKVATAVNVPKPVFVDTPDFINPGDWVEVRVALEGNNRPSNPGIYVNYDAVCLRGYGTRIVTAVSIEEMGFGSSPTPSGASSVPVGSAMPAEAPTPPAPPAAAAPVPTVPNTGALNPPPPPSGPKYVLTDVARAAGATSVETLIASPGWSEAIALQHGYIVAA